MITLYFTATGNCLYVAKTIRGDLVSIPQAIKNGQYSFSDDKIGLVLPVYWAMIPKYTEDFLRKVKLDSNYIFAVLTFGMIAGSAQTHLRNIAKECGINFSYINKIKMVDNYLPIFEMKKQIETEPKKHVERHLESIVADICASRKYLPKGSFYDNWMISMMKRRELIGAGAAKDFYIEDTCNGCGTCANVCSMRNVTMKGQKPEFGAQCMTCLACTHNCPQNSIRLKGEKSRARFRNKHIPLKEIIDSNK